MAKTRVFSMFKTNKLFNRQENNKKQLDLRGATLSHTVFCSDVIIDDTTNLNGYQIISTGKLTIEREGLGCYRNKR